ncbi:MAG: transcription antitermination factor NusB [Gammaproteobacteria bacterium]|jgi:N utilization substance protein B
MNKIDGQKFSKHARIRSRRSIIQAYYQWIITEQPISEIILEFKKDRKELKKADVPYFEKLLVGMIKGRLEIISALEPLLDRPDSELDPVENAILHLGAYELIYQLDIPSKVVINEAIDLAKLFGAEQSHKYINGILDKLAHKIRQTEFASYK